jgi:hypothetical protein
MCPQSQNAFGTLKWTNVMCAQTLLHMHHRCGAGCLGLGGRRPQIIVCSSRSTATQHTWKFEAAFRLLVRDVHEVYSEEGQVLKCCGVDHPRSRYGEGPMHALWPPAVLCHCPTMLSIEHSVCCVILWSVTE